MDFQGQEFPIVFIWWMIEKKNFQLLKNIHFDKRVNLNDKIQFSLLILNHHRHWLLNLRDIPTKKKRFCDAWNNLWDT
jgi:hypothetical protein